MKAKIHAKRKKIMHKRNDIKSDRSGRVVMIIYKYIRVINVYFIYSGRAAIMTKSNELFTI